MCDLLWSDPMDDEEEDTSTDLQYVNNDIRGCSYVFSYEAVTNFLKTNNLLSVIRAHEAQDEGYRLYKRGTQTQFPTVICIFSAPNYCDSVGNKGALIRYKGSDMKPNYIQFRIISQMIFILPFVVILT